MILTSIGALALMACIGYRLGRKGQNARVFSVLLGIAAVFLFCALVGKTGEGFDGIGYVIVAFLICLPGGAGLLGGALLGWLVRRSRIG